MIFSENRYPLFRIMQYEDAGLHVVLAPSTAQAIGVTLHELVKRYNRCIRAGATPFASRFFGPRIFARFSHPSAEQNRIIAVRRG
jgi:hypothetical protein